MLGSTIPGVTQKKRTREVGERVSRVRTRSTHLGAPGPVMSDPRPDQQMQPYPTHEQHFHQQWQYDLQGGQQLHEPSPQHQHRQYSLEQQQQQQHLALLQLQYEQKRQQWQGRQAHAAALHESEQAHHFGHEHYREQQPQQQFQCAAGTNDAPAPFSAAATATAAAAAAAHAPRPTKRRRGHSTGAGAADSVAGLSSLSDKWWKARALALLDEASMAAMRRMRHRAAEMLTQPGVDAGFAAGADVTSLHEKDAGETDLASEDGLPSTTAEQAASLPSAATAFVTGKAGDNSEQRPTAARGSSGSGSDSDGSEHRDERDAANRTGNDKAKPGSPSSSSASNCSAANDDSKDSKFSKSRRRLASEAREEADAVAAVEAFLLATNAQVSCDAVRCSVTRGHTMLCPPHLPIR